MCENDGLYFSQVPDTGSFVVGAAGQDVLEGRVPDDVEDFFGVALEGLYCVRLGGRDVEYAHDAVLTRCC